MSVSYRIEIERGSFSAAGEWRALVYKDDEVVNCFVGDWAHLVTDEAAAAIHWHEANNPAADLHSVKA